MFCNKCGAQLPDGVAFCSYCGNQLTAQPQQPEQPTQPQYQQPVQPQYEQPMQQPIQQPYQPAPMPQPLPPKKSNKGIIIGIVAVVLVIAIVVGVLFGTGVIGGKSKDDGDDKDDKTTTSQTDNSKSKDGSESKDENIATALNDITLCLADGTNVNLGDKLSVLEGLKDTTVDISTVEMEVVNFDSSIAPGQTLNVSFYSSSFDYTTIEVWITAANTTDSEIAVRDAEIIGINLEKDEPYNNEKMVSLMGLTTASSKDEVKQLLDSKGFVLDENFNYASYSAYYDGEGSLDLANGSYGISDDSYEGGDDYDIVAKTNKNELIIVSFWEIDSIAQPEYSVYSSYYFEHYLPDEALK